MKRDGSGTPTIVAISVLLILVVAIGAGLQTRLFFAGPIVTPGLKAAQPRNHGAPHIQTPATGAPRYSNQNTVFGLAPIIIVLSILALAVIVTLVLLWLRHRPRRRTTQVAGLDADIGQLDDAEQSAADLPTLQRGLSLATEVLESGREPRDAIVRAWLGLQEAAEDSGMKRGPAETPTEFTARVFASVRADRQAADTLLALYLRVRFGSRPATAEDVDEAHRAVAALSATWPVGVNQ